MDCPSCGAYNPESATFCSLCLTNFAPPATAPRAAASVGAAAVCGAGVYGAAATPAPAMTAPVAPSALDFEAQAAAYLGATPSAGYGVPVLQYGVWPILFLLGVGVWIASGGWASMEAGKVARIPVPVNSQLVGTVEEVTRGLIGPLSKERREVYATRVFAVPLSSTAALDYYRTGAGANGLAEAGPTVEHDLLGGDHQKWTREAAVGYRAREEQELHMWFGDSYLARDVKGAAIPAGDSVVRVMCGGMDVERLEYPQR